MLFNVAVTEVIQLVAMPGQPMPKEKEKIIFGPKTIAAPDKTVALLLIGQEIKLKDVDPANLEVSIVPFDRTQGRKKKCYDEDDDD